MTRTWSHYCTHRRRFCTPCSALACQHWRRPNRARGRRQARQCCSSGTYSLHCTHRRRFCTSCSALACQHWRRPNRARGRSWQCCSSGTYSLHCAHRRQTCTPCSAFAGQLLGGPSLAPGHSGGMRSNTLACDTFACKKFPVDANCFGRQYVTKKRKITLCYFYTLQNPSDFASLLYSFCGI